MNTIKFIIGLVLLSSLSLSAQDCKLSDKDNSTFPKPNFDSSTLCKKINDVGVVYSVESGIVEFYKNPDGIDNKGNGIINTNLITYQGFPYLWSAGNTGNQKSSISYSFDVYQDDVILYLLVFGNNGSGGYDAANIQAYDQSGELMDIKIENFDQTRDVFTIDGSSVKSKENSKPSDVAVKVKSTDPAKKISKIIVTDEVTTRKKGLGFLVDLCASSIKNTGELKIEEKDVCEGEAFTLPNPYNGVPGDWSPSAYDPTASATYTFTPKDKFSCFTQKKFKFLVRPKTPVFKSLVACQGDPDPRPKVSDNGITGTWSGDFDLDNTRTYKFTPDDGQRCAVSVDVEVVVQQKNPIFSPISVCQGDPDPRPTTSENGIKGHWSGTYDPEKTKVYTFIPDATQKCATTVDLEVVVMGKLPTFKPIIACKGDSDPRPLISENGIKGRWLENYDKENTKTYTFTPNSDLKCAKSVKVEVVVQNSVPTFKPIVVCQGDPDPRPKKSDNGITGTWSDAYDKNKSKVYIFIPDQGSKKCSNSAELHVTVIPKKPIFDDIAPICQGVTDNPLPSESKNGIKGTWSPSFNSDKTTTYTFKPTSGQNCAESVTLEVVVNPKMIPEFDIPTTICEGLVDNPLVSKSKNGITGRWKPFFNSKETTTYTFIPTRGQKCVDSIKLEIVVTKQIKPKFDVIPPVCEGTTVSPLPLQSKDGIKGTWSPSFNSIETTKYTFTPESGQTCAESVQLEVIITPKKEPDFGVIPPVCKGSSKNPLPLQSKDGVKGTWLPEFNSDITTTYTFTPDQGQECYLVKTVTVEVQSDIVPTFEPITICKGDDDPRPKKSIEEISGRWLEPFDPNTTKTYTFVPKESEGNCVANGNLVITIKDCENPDDDPDNKFQKFKVYNIITNNGNNLNKYFSVQGIDEFPDNTLKIYDRRGQVVFEKENYTSKDQWDGKYQGDILPIGVYYYVIVIRKDKKINSQTGWMYIM